MKKKNFLIVLLCLVIVILGIISVLLNRQAFENTLIATGLKEATPILANADPYLEKLLHEIPVLQVMPKKKKAKRDIWKVGRGISFPNYLLRAQKHLVKNGGKILAMEELENSKGSVATMDFIAPFGDTFYVELQMADSFHNNTSRLAVAFYAEKNLAGFTTQLNHLNYPYSLLITPADLPTLSSGLKSLNSYESVIWLPMESKGYLPKSVAKSSILIHLSEKEIQNVVNDAIEKIPNAIGVATRFSDRAVELSTLLKAVFLPLKAQNLWFMDLTANRYSKTQEVCEEISLNCHIESPFNPARMTHEIYTENVLRLARRSGKAILILPLSNATFKAIENLEADALAQGTEFVSLSNIFQKE